MKSTLLTLLTFFAALALYLSTLAPGMLRGDSGEFQWAMTSLNVAHATGYPLFTLVGYVWQMAVPIGSVAYRLNLLAAIFGALSVALVFRFAYALTQRAWAALTAAFFLATAPVFWFNASVLEVYTLNTLFLVAVLYLLFLWEKTRTLTFLLFAFFFFGLSLAHHRLMLLAAPAMAIYILVVQPRFYLNPLKWIAAALMLVPGLALYAYVPLRMIPAGATYNDWFYGTILGQAFSASYFRQFNLQVLAQVPWENFHAGLILALIGIGVLFRRAWKLATLFVLVYLLDVIFAAGYAVPDPQVFLTPGFVIIALAIGIGADWVARELGRRAAGDEARGSLGKRVEFATGFLLMLVALLSLGSKPMIEQAVAAEHGDAEDRARAILAADLPQGAMLELDWETATAARFIQTTEQTRTDLEARLIKINQRDELARVLQNMDAGRPVFFDSGVELTRFAAGYTWAREADGLIRVTRANEEYARIDARVSERVRVVGWRADQNNLVLYWQATKPLDKDYSTFVHFFDADGHALGQQDKVGYGEATYGYRPTEWEAGQTVADFFKPLPEGTTYLRLGMYALNGTDIEPYGQTVRWQVAPLTLDGMTTRVGVQFGDAIVLRGYDLKRAGDNATLMLFWQAQKGMKTDYTVFVHAVDGANKIVQQVDRQPLVGIFPTSAWREGQIIREVYQIATGGAAVLRVGLYDAATSLRLARGDGKGDFVEIELGN